MAKDGAFGVLIGQGGHSVPPQGRMTFFCLCLRSEDTTRREPPDPVRPMGTVRWARVVHCSWREAQSEVLANLL